MFLKIIITSIMIKINYSSNIVHKWLDKFQNNKNKKYLKKKESWKNNRTNFILEFVVYATKFVCQVPVQVFKYLLEPS